MFGVRYPARISFGNCSWVGVCVCVMFSSVAAEGCSQIRPFDPVLEIEKSPPDDACCKMTSGYVKRRLIKLRIKMLDEF